MHIYMYRCIYNGLTSIMRLSARLPVTDPGVKGMILVIICVDKCISICSGGVQIIMSLKSPQWKITTRLLLCVV